MNSTKTIYIGIVAVIVIALLGYFAWQERGASNASAPQGTAATSTATTTASTSTGQTITISPTGTTISGGYTIKPVTGPAAPNYKKPLTYPSNMDTTTVAQDQSEFAAVQIALASNPVNFEAWLELGILREATGDYTGAAADWKYLTEIYPSDPTAYANLGDLYANYLHQPAQGISYYKLAIKADPTKEASLYENLSEIYLAEGDKTNAKAILQQGINAQVIGYQNLVNDLHAIQ